MHLLFSKPAFDAFQIWRNKMNEAEELQAILSEPGKAVGKYFDDVGGKAVYIFHDRRTLPFNIVLNYPLQGYRNRDGVWGPENYTDTGLTNLYHKNTLSLTRVRKADPNRNLNLKVGDTVELVNGDVVTLTARGDEVVLDNDGRMWCDTNGWSVQETGGLAYDPHHILKVITRAAKGGVMDSDVIKKLREDVDAISARVHELEGLA